MSEAVAPTEARLRNSLLGYGVMLLAPVGLFALVCWWGQGLEPAGQAAAGPVRPAASAGASTLVQVLLALAAILAAGWGLGKLLAALGQPPVIGEMLAGIALGPSLLGMWLPPSIWLPERALATLEVVAHIGILLYLFLVGLELNTSMLRRQAGPGVAVSHASITAPFLLGGLLALALYPAYAPAGQAFTPFALFLGVALSITAFPVLARILSDSRLEQTPLGVLALACAAIGDLTAWCLLALVVSLTRAVPETGALTVLLAVGYLGLMLGVVRPAVARWLPRLEERTTERTLTMAVLLGLLLSALAAEAIGVHALFGAFLAGAVIPHESQTARRLGGQLRDGITLLLLPAFFAVTGLKTQTGLLDSAAAWLVCAAIIAVATLGKVGGSYLAARLAGIDARTAAALGVLMNTRGLMELVVLNIGLDLGVLSPRLFAMMVVMALATTIATTPVVRLLLPAAEPASAPPPSAGRDAGGMRAVMPIGQSDAKQ